MKKSLLWEVIAGFSSQEVRDFRRFLRSPYFNTREDLPVIFEYLAKNKSRKPPPRTEVFQAIFPGKDFTKTEIRLLLSYLFRLVEQFLIIEENKKNTVGEKQTLLAVYKNRNLTRHLRKTLKQTEKMHTGAGQRHPEFYLEKYYLEREEYLLQTKEGRTQELNLQNLEDNLDAAFISFKLRQACIARSHEAVYNTHYDTRLIDLLLSAAQEENFRKVPAVAVYFLCYQALYHAPTDENFRRFREKLIEVTPDFPQEEIRTLLLLALNYCIKKINKSESLYLQEALDLYRTGLDNDLLLENGYLSRFAFNNIVGIALRLGEFTWTENFVKTKQNALPAHDRAAAFHLNSARLEYARRRYDNALLHLQKSDYRDSINNMTAKILQMKIYCETREFSLLESHLNSMEMYIRRNKKISYHYENWRNIIRYTRRLAEVNAFDKNALEKLRKEIETEEILTEKKWLTEQIEKL